MLQYILYKVYTRYNESNLETDLKQALYLTPLLKEAWGEAQAKAQEAQEKVEWRSVIAALCSRRDETFK